MTEQVARGRGRLKGDMVTGNEGSNPTLSAIALKVCGIKGIDSSYRYPTISSLKPKKLPESQY